MKKGRLHLNTFFEGKKYFISSCVHLHVKDPFVYSDGLSLKLQAQKRILLHISVETTIHWVTVIER